MPAISALIVKVEDEFKAILGYIARSCLRKPKYEKEQEPEFGETKSRDIQPLYWQLIALSVYTSFHFPAFSNIL